MLNRRDEDDLRQLFARWRREESAIAPSIERTLTAVRERLTTGRRTRRWRYLAVVGPLAASVALWLAWGTAPRREGPPMMPDPTAHVAPARVHIPERTWWSTMWWEAEDSSVMSMLEATLEAEMVGVLEPVADEAYVQGALEGE
jgi:hypothetical protein